MKIRELVSSFCNEKSWASVSLHKLSELWIHLFIVLSPRKTVWDLWSAVACGYGECRFLWDWSSHKFRSFSEKKNAQIQYLVHNKSFFPLPIDYILVFQMLKKMYDHVVHCCVLTANWCLLHVRCVSWDDLKLGLNIQCPA